MRRCPLPKQQDITDSDARRRRAQLFASSVGDDDEAPIKVARGHGLDLDLARDDDDDNAGSGSMDPKAAVAAAAAAAAAGSTEAGADGSQPAAVDGSQQQVSLAAAGSGSLGIRSGSGVGTGAGLLRLRDPVEARRLLRAQSQEAAARQAKLAAQHSKLVGGWVGERRGRLLATCCMLQCLPVPARRRACLNITALATFLFRGGCDVWAFLSSVLGPEIRATHA